MPKRLEVIVPVHNGEIELPRMLAALAPQVWDEVRVTLVLNGCSDASEAIARDGLATIQASGAEARLLQAPRASRPAALNTGETDAQGHRLYLDQDAVLSPDALRLILDAIDSGAHFVGAGALWRTRSPLVAMAMQAWNHIPYVVEQPVTAGMYAVSASGRARWGAWPDALPDDKFARLQFAPAERVRPAGLTYSVAAPDSFAGLIAARRRYFQSNVALREARPELFAQDGARYDRLWRLAPAQWPGAIVLAAAEAGARLGAR
ncbi:glycosyltransferase family 2 protein [Phenylobacterium sp.]|uniref:glycosyltransferase n=1 Tax=Phenylobacterium sp. TaxID=1871053 RepID=UPI002ED9E400